MKLSYEYNEYVIGYIVTDEESDRTLNFQFEKFNSNHPTPDFYLAPACAGDETHLGWTEEEQIEAKEWLRNHSDVIELEDAFTKAFYENYDFRENCYSSEITINDIFEAAKND